MDKRLWLNLSLAALAAVLGLFIYLHRDGPAAPPPPTLTGMSADEVRHITISRHGEADIQLVRRDGNWWMTQPLQVAANRQRVDTLLALLSQSSYGRFASNGMDLEAIGLARPRVSVRFDQTRIDFGLTEPLNQRRYVLVGGQVQLIDDNNYYSVIAQLKHYISLQLLAPDEQLASISTPRLRVHKVGQGWRLDSGQTPRSGDDLMRLVQTWQSASALEVIPAKATGARGHPIIELGLAGGRPSIRLAILSRQPDLLLLRLDKPLQYKFTAHQAEQMLQLSPDSH
jgi:hypothetical protein